MNDPNRRAQQAVADRINAGRLPSILLDPELLGLTLGREHDPSIKDDRVTIAPPGGRPRHMTDEDFGHLHQHVADIGFSLTRPALLQMLQQIFLGEPSPQARAAGRQPYQWEAERAAMVRQASGLPVGPPPAPPRLERAQMPFIGRRSER